MKLPSKWAVIWGTAFLAVALFCGYFGVRLCIEAHRGTPVRATMGECHHGYRGGELCEGTWTEDGHVVHGTVEADHVQDGGKQIEVAVVGGRGFVRSEVSGLWFTALLFALLFGSCAVMFFRGKVV